MSIIYNYGGSARPPYSNTKSTLFDGVDEYATGGNVLDFDRGDKRSFSFWMKITNSGVIPFSKLGGSASWYIYTVPASYIEMQLNCAPGGGNYKCRVLCSALNSWHHFVWCYNGDSLATTSKWYIDGVLQSNFVEDSNLTGSFSNSGPFTVGHLATDAYFFGGNLDEIGIYNDMLSGAEVTAIYNAGVPTDLMGLTSTTKLLAYWRMGDNDTFPTITDQKSTNHLTMVNMESGDFVSSVP